MVNESPTSLTAPITLEYANAAGPAFRWGLASLYRAALAVLLFLYSVSAIEEIRPRDNLAGAFFWPLTLTICSIGIVYGAASLRADRRKHLAIIALVIQSLLGAAAASKTWQAGHDVYDAYKYNGGIIISSDR
jgi:hypothetical protein